MLEPRAAGSDKPAPTVGGGEQVGRGRGPGPPPTMLSHDKNYMR